MPLSNGMANNILNYLFGKAALDKQVEVYIGLSSNDPEADNGTFTELSGGSYSRVLVSVFDQQYPDYFGTASNRSMTNNRQINWTKATANWATAKGFGLFDTKSGGTPYYYAALDAPYPTTEAGAVALFDPQALTVGFATADIHTATVSTE